MHALTNRIMYAYINCDSELGTYAIRSTDENWIFIPYSFEIKDTTKPADFGVGTNTVRRPDKWLDGLDQ
jgi:hypothetical protein